MEKARKYIYKEHYAVGAEVVENQLKPTSLVAAKVRVAQRIQSRYSLPKQNAFSDRLSPMGFDIHDIVAVDVLHEVEIGVWKSLFIHLLRLLEAVGVGKTDVLNSR